MRQIAFVAGVAMAILTPGTSQAGREISPDVVAAKFASQLDDFIGALDAHTDRYAIRINRCVGRRGEIADDRFYVWIGWRGIAGSNNASDVVADALAAKRAAGWEIFRDRRLENGGRNIAATDPGSGYSYTLDTGFDAGPDSLIVGFFTTRCFLGSPGSVSYGPWTRTDGLRRGE